MSSWISLNCHVFSANFSSTVVQLAKRDGFRVIATAGTQAKVDFVKSCGADVAFNYKEEKIRDVLVREGPINMSAFLFRHVMEMAADIVTCLVQFLGSPRR